MSSTRSRLPVLLAASLLIIASLPGCSATDERAVVFGNLSVLVPSSPGSDEAFETMNAAFEAAYPHVNVQFSAVDEEDFLEARTARLAAGTVDITVARPQETADWVNNDSASADSIAARSGAFIDLSKKPFVKNYIPGLIDLLRYNGKVFAVPTGISYSTGVYYNVDLFDRLHLEVPTTWDEFLEVATAISGAGVTPLGIAGKEPRAAETCMLAVVQSLYPTARDKAALAENVWRNRVGLAVGKQLLVLKRVETLFSFADPGFANVSYSSIPAAFADGEFAMTIDGTWDQIAIDAAVGDAFDYGYFPLPASDDPEDNGRLGAKLEMSLVAVENGQNSPAALAYLDYFSKPGPYARFIEMAGFASTQSVYNPDNVFLTGIARYVGLYSPGWDTIWVRNVAAGPAADSPFNYSAIAPLGDLTAEQAAEVAQSDWDAAR